MLHHEGDVTAGGQRPRIVVGLDGSTGSAHVLAAADQERRLRSARLEVMGVWHLSTTFGWVLSPELVDDLRSHTRRAVQRVVHEVLGDPPPGEVTVDIEEGHPASVLCRAAAGADLLVVGSRGHAAVPGTRLGSVSLHCAHSAPCPVLIVPVAVAAEQTSAADAARATGHLPGAVRQTEVRPAVRSPG